MPFLGTNLVAVQAHEAADVAAWLAASYAVLVPFDTDLNGVLDATEQAALSQAFETDTVPPGLFLPLLPERSGQAIQTGGSRRRGH